MAKELQTEEQEWECPHCHKSIIIPGKQTKQTDSKRCPKCNAETVKSKDGTVRCVACTWVKEPDE